MLHVHSFSQFWRKSALYAVLRIHDILVWIRIRGSMALTNESGSGDPAIFVINLQDANKKNFFCQKEVTKQLESRFCLLFLLRDRRIRIRIQEAQKTYGSDGSGSATFFIFIHVPPRCSNSRLSPSRGPRLRTLWPTFSQTTSTFQTPTNHSLSLSLCLFLPGLKFFICRPNTYHT